VASAPEHPAPAATIDWAVFAPVDAADVARSQITAFEQAGPQQLPQQTLQLADDDAFASVPLETDFGRDSWLAETQTPPGLNPDGVCVVYSAQIAD